jgi:signal transduction histidine kinase
MYSTETTAFLGATFFLGGLIFLFVLLLVSMHRKWEAKMTHQLLREIGLLEKDRVRIAKDLHDEIAPILMLSAIQAEKAQVVSDSDKELLQTSAGNLRNTMLRLGEIVRNLNPAVLEMKGLKAALDDLIERYAFIKGISIRHSYNITSTIPPTPALHLYRIVQEIIQNAIKHSGATDIELEFSEKKGKVIILYMDNGIGIEGHPITGLGLKNLRERISLLQGSVKMITEKNKGTRYHIDFPLYALYE